MSAPVSAQVITSAWRQESPAHFPPARGYFGSTLDAKLGEVVVFGGIGGTSNRNDTWVWDGLDWTQKTANGASSSPGARRYPAMSYDAKLGETVLFGGRNDSFVDYGDTWVWNGVSWSQRTPPGAAPPARHGASMAYDAKLGQTVLFGGYDTGPRNDTWIWDGATWTQKLANGCSGCPPVRDVASMAYDPVRNEVVLFGGYGSGATLRNDTWVWNGLSWSQRKANGCSDCPSARAYGNLAFDAASGRMLLFGGRTASGLARDTWVWDGSGWTELSSPTSPAAREGARMETHPISGVVLFGGWDGSTYRNDTWTFGVGTQAGQDPHSSECSNGAVVVDGFAADSTIYTKLRTHTDEATGDLWVCFRVDAPGAHAGGKLVVGEPDPEVPPAPDDDGTACEADAANNRLPGPHPVASGSVGPGNEPLALDVYSNGDEAWVCVVAGTTSKRVVVPLGGVGAAVLLDNPTPYASPDDWPAGVPSRLCKDEGGNAALDLVNSDIGDGHVWLTTWAESTTQLRLCFRAHTPAGDKGAVITADGSWVTSIHTQEGVDSDTSPCTVNLLTLTDPDDFFVRVAPAGSNPMSVCVSVGTEDTRAYVGVEGATVLPVQCTEDPGTENIC